MQYDEFLRAVERETGMEDRQQAERAARVVLQALVDRITPEEADDLLAQLPGPLKETIEPRERPLKLDADEFVDRVAIELNVTTDEAHEIVHGVFAVLRQAVTPGELEDVLAQLPSGYARLLTA